MEFWGIEVPSGKPVTCYPGDDSYLHVTQIALGEKPAKGNERVYLRVKVEDDEIIIGTLSQEKCDQMTVDLIFEDEFVLSHSGSSSVFFCGYRTNAVGEEENFNEEEDESEESSEEEEEEDKEDIQMLDVKDNGKMPETMMPREKHSSRVVEIPIVEVKPEVPEAKEMSKKEARKKVGVPVIETVKPQHPKTKLTSLKEEVEESDEDKYSGSDDSEEERPESDRTRYLPKKQSSNKSKKPNIPSEGKPDLGTLKQQKKSAGKDAQSMSPKSLGSYICTPCNKKFSNESALKQHNNAKHK